MSDINYALSTYFLDKGVYPSASTCSNGTKSNCSLSSISSLLAEYILSVPKTSYSLAGGWSFGSGYQVPIANQYGYVGLGSRYIFTYHTTDTRDSNQYRVIDMPDRNLWLAENLEYKTANSACYDDTESNCAGGYGRLYTRDDAQKACLP
jgi:hypothetical protein